MNNIILMGRLTDTPEQRATPSGTAVTTFTLAVDRRFANTNGERATDFIPCKAWSKTAEFIAKHFIKGQLILIAGTLQSSKYTDREGAKRTYYEVIIDNAEFTGDKRNTVVPDRAVKTYTFSAGSDADFAVIESDQDLPF